MILQASSGVSDPGYSFVLIAQERGFAARLRAAH
jgi:hypothetical protein